MKKADLPHGRVTFAKTCGGCHQLHGEGGRIGPDLTGSNRADLEYLLANLLDPSAMVGRDPYPNARQSANWTCTGLLAHESAMHGAAIRQLPEWTFP